MGIFSLFRKSKRLIRAFEKIADTSSFASLSAEEKYKKAENLYNSKQDFELCVSLLVESADGGYADAQYQLGNMLIAGDEIEEDYDKAFIYIKKASDQNHAKAAYDLGYLYQNGFGCAKDFQKALEAYKKSANFGFVDAIHQVGAFYWEGLGVTQDENKAIEWFKKACERDYVPSLVIMGNIYYNLEEDEESYKYLCRAAELGSDEAEELLEDEVYDRFR